MTRQEKSAPGLQITQQHENGRVDLVLSGELDMASAAILQAAVAEVVDAGQRAVRLDLAGVDFCDSSGISALIQARDTLRSLGGTLVVDNANGLTLRTLTMTGVLDLLSRPEPDVTTDT